MEKQIKAKLEKIESLMENLLATFVSTSEKPLDLAEPAAYLSLSKSHLYHLTSEGLIPHYKPNGKKNLFSEVRSGFLSTSQSPRWCSGD